MSAFGADEEDDDLPERIIVVREPASGELEALAADVADGADEGSGGDGRPAIELDAAEDPERVEAELEALVAEVASVDPEPAAAEEPVAPAIDLDEVDLRAEHAPLEADQAWLDALAADDVAADDDAEDFGDGPGEVIELHAERDDLDALAADVAAEQVEHDLEQDRQVLDAPATELEPPSAPESSPRGGERDETGPGTLRPKVPEPVIAARTLSPPSRPRRTLRRLRALVGLLLVVVLAGVGLAGAIGGAVLLVVLVLSRAFGSGP